MEPVKYPRRLLDLLDFDRSVEIIGTSDPFISHLADRAQLVQPGALFFARPGCLHDGASFTDEALQRGAVAIVAQTLREDISAIQIITEDVVGLMGKIADRFYGSASHELLLIGVTGTAGKTSVTYWLRYFFETLGIQCGLIGTIEWIARERREASLTTPGCLELHALMAQMVEAGCRACVMEVSSHSLDQGRVAGLEFDVAIFTNLSPEHLDYHKTMEAYGAAKKKLFQLAPVAVVNAEDPFSDQLQPKGGISSGRIAYGRGGECFYADGHLHLFGKRVPIDLDHLAHFQQLNLLAALTTLVSLGFDLCCEVGDGLESEGSEYDILPSLLDSIAHFPGVPGRMEEVENSLGLRIVVDYAHKPGALESVLKALREQTGGRLLLVFGCGGERDRLKRPQMGAIAARYADELWITSDNPRGEDPLAIIDEIERGARGQSSKDPAAEELSDPVTCIIHCEVCRTRAIFAAAHSLEPGDLLLIAGRGHEKEQLIGQERIPLHDATVAAAALEESGRKWAKGGVSMGQQK